MQKLEFRQPRESRLLAGVIVLVFGVGLAFFSTLVVLESAVQLPIVASLFLLVGIIMVFSGLYFIACVPALEVNPKTRTVDETKSCLIYTSKNELPFKTFREAGVKELYRAGSYTEESGTSYFVELRGQKTIEVPGTKSYYLDETASIAGNIAKCMGIPFNPKIRKVKTGSVKLK